MAPKGEKYRITESVTQTNIFKIRSFPVFLNCYKENQFYRPLLIPVASGSSKRERPAQSQATNAHKDSLHTDFTLR